MFPEHLSRRCVMAARRERGPLCTPPDRRRGPPRAIGAAWSPPRRVSCAALPRAAAAGTVRSRHGHCRAPQGTLGGPAPVQDATGAGRPAGHLEDIEHGDLRRERPESRQNQPRPSCATDRDARDRVTGAEVASLCRGRLRSDTPVTDDVQRNTLEWNREDTVNARQAAIRPFFCRKLKNRGHFSVYDLNLPIRSGVLSGPEIASPNRVHGPVMHPPGTAQERLAVRKPRAQTVERETGPGAFIRAFPKHSIQ